MSDSENKETNLNNTCQQGSQTAGEQPTTPSYPANQPTSSNPQNTAGAPAPQPYAAIPPQQQPYVAGQAPQQPYYTAPQNPYGAPPSPYGVPAAPQQPKKKWPWVLIACVLAFLLGLGGCVGCATISMVTDSLHTRSDSVHSYDYDDPYGYDPADAPDSDAYGRFTLGDIQDAAGNLPNQVQDGKATAGVYVVGRDIDAGEYFLQGSPSVESEFYLFDPEGSGTFSLDCAVSYTGNYFAELENGEVIAFMPKIGDALMVPSNEADFQPQQPYQSGLYRVGTDIPAGTYTVTVSPNAPHDASQDYAAYVMQDLAFDDDSITDSVYLLRGSTQTITVNDGDWLELFGTVATPSN